MISDLNLEEKADELWRGFSPTNDADFWQAYVKYLAQAQKKQQAPVVSIHTNIVTQASTKGILVSEEDKPLVKVYQFSGKAKRLINLPREWRIGVWVFILLGFGLSYLLQSGLIVFISVILLWLMSITFDKPSIFELNSHELVIDLGHNDEEFVKRCFTLKDIDQISVSFNSHCDAYTLHVKTSSSEESFSYNLSVADHQRFYEALRAYKVYVGKWHHPSL